MKHKCFIGAFLILCMIPFYGMLFCGTSSALANEHLSPEPDLWTSEGTLNTGVLDESAAYISDHFAFRANLITANSLLYTTLFHTTTVNDVIQGKDGWLYYSKTLQDYQRTAPLNDDQLEQIAQIIAQLQAECKQKGAQFLFVVAPNKNTLYPERMPARFAVLDEASNWERLQPYLQDSGVLYLDVVQCLQNDNEIVYYKTDSHWTNKGAMRVHAQIMQALELPHTDFASLAEKDLEQILHVGDLYTMLYPTRAQGEMDLQYPFTFSYAREPRSAEDILIETTSAALNGGLLFCRDSFGNALYPFLAEDFSNGTITRQMPYPLEAVGTGDVVIIEIVERNLGNILTVYADPCA